MGATTTTEHEEHLRHAQDHFRWRIEHMEALATLRRVEAELFAHEARILAHDAEIARHEEHIAHGGGHAPPPPAGEHAVFAGGHGEGHEHHAALIEAIKRLNQLLSQKGA